MGLLGRIFLCIFVVSALLYRYVDQQNGLIVLRLEIPRLEKELRRIEEKNTTLRYRVEQYESPIHLMELSRQPEYGHLKHPNLKDVVLLPKAEPIDLIGSR